ncbi:hypothetical protein SVIOM74S_03028 [Streptomyces violarus]
MLQEVWGYDYFGGTRTVDVHVRRLRAKLGPEHESLIGTVRNVGYRFVTPEKVERAAEEAKGKADRAEDPDTDERLRRRRGARRGEGVGGGPRWASARRAERTDVRRARVAVPHGTSFTPCPERVYPRRLRAWPR